MQRALLCSNPYCNWGAQSSIASQSQTLRENGFRVLRNQRQGESARRPNSQESRIRGAGYDGARAAEA
jgi:hypothetical protein